MADHVFPEPGRAAVKGETEIFEAVISHESRESFDAEELDMSAIVQRRVVCIHLSRRSERKILEISVIRRTNQNLTAGLQKRASGTEQVGWPIHVLNHIARHHQIEFPETKLTIDQRFNKLHVRVCTSRDRDPTRRRINSGDLITELRESPGNMPIPASEIANRSHTLKLPHELDEDTRQLLARFTIARTLGEPLKLAVR